MKGVVFITLTVVLLVAPTRTVAQDSSYETFLVPVYAPIPISGALGSRWTTEFWIRNGNDHEISVRGFGECGSLPECSIQYNLEAEETVVASPIYNPCHGNAGVTLSIPKDDAKQVQFDLRIHEVTFGSFQGVEIPVVRQTELHDSTLHILGVPLDSRYPNLLRIYLVNPKLLDHEYRWRVAVTDGMDGRVLSAREVTASAKAYVYVSGEPLSCAGEANVAAVFEEALERVPNQTVHVQLTPLFEDGSEFWAFVSGTSNQTQEVTIFTPQ